MRGIFLVYETRKIICPIDFITDFIFFIFNADLYALLSILLGLLKNSTGYSGNSVFYSLCYSGAWYCKTNKSIFLEVEIKGKLSALSIT